MRFLLPDNKGLSNFSNASSRISEIVFIVYLEEWKREEERLTGRLSCLAFLADMRIKAAAPSDTGLEFPAVTPSVPPKRPFSVTIFEGSFFHGPSSLDTSVFFPPCPGTLIGSISCQEREWFSRIEAYHKNQYGKRYTKKKDLHVKERRIVSPIQARLKQLPTSAIKCFPNCFANLKSSRVYNFSLLAHCK